MNPIANLPQRFSKAVTGRGAHLQVQFLVKNEQGDINLVPEAFIFRNDRSNLDDLDVYPVKKGGIPIPTEAVGMIIFGVQEKYATKEKIFEKGFDPDEKTYPGIKVDTEYSPQFFNLALYCDGRVNNAVESINPHLYGAFNYSVSEEGRILIVSFTLTESLYKIHNFQEEFEGMLAKAIIEQATY